MVSVGTDTLVTLWDVAGGRGGTPARELRGHRWDVYGVAWSPDGKLLACGTYQRGVQVWDVAAHTLRWADRAQAALLRRVAWSPDGTRLASGGG